MRSGGPVLSRPVNDDAEARAANIAFGVGVFGTLFFTGMWSLLSAVEPDYSPKSELISALSATSAIYHNWMRLGIAALAVGVGCLGFLIWRTWHLAVPTAIAGLTTVTFIVTAIAMQTCSLGKPDCAAEMQSKVAWGTNNVHGVAATTSMAMLIILSLIFARFGWKSGRTRYGIVSLGLGAVSLLLFLMAVSSGTTPRDGVFQRMIFSFTVIWMLLTMVTIRRERQGQAALDPVGATPR